jgi:DNA replication licensing factor MCM5
LALHIINVHKNRDLAVRQMNEVAIEPEKLKKYIAFVRARCKPRLSAEAAELLKNRYIITPHNTTITLRALMLLLRSGM